ncbi:transmembrane protein 35B-like [Branchiostoma lanceolatum]|uniref:TMEM35A protein n=1 Tax=Branchiostoma lanceolatum TaxID=7740 RepID=A0A8J9YN83_BRALA|nr:TMEM35A [Branchiostoma lanceolatum]
MAFGKIAVTIASVTLGVLFVFKGAVKLFPEVNEEIYQDFVMRFGRYSPVFPLADLTGFRPPPDLYRQFVAWTELIAAPMLILFGGTLGTLANVTLFGVMFGGVFTHVTLGDPVYMYAQELALLIVLGCLFMLRRLEASKAAKEKDQ